MDPAQAQTNAAIVQAVVAIIQLACTAFLVIVTYKYVWITQEQLKAFTSPYVVVYAKNDNARPTLIQIVIENVGRGVAMDVRFELSRPIPFGAWGVSEARARNPDEPVMLRGPLVHGIPALTPGETREINWGQYHGLRGLIGDDGVRVKCRFKHGSIEMEPVECVLEIGSLAIQDIVDTDGARQSAKQLRRIAEVVVQRQAKEDQERWIKEDEEERAEDGDAD
jgi:hypothetical protein